MIGSALSLLDAALAFLPAAVRLLLYGAVAGGGAMLLYGWLSPQDRLAELQRALGEARGRMHAYDGDDPRVIGGLVKESLKLSFRQIRLVFLPTLLAAAPVLLGLAWLDAAYAHTLPDVGDPVEVRYWTASGAEPAPDSPVAWPSPDEPITLEGPSGTALVRLPLEHPRARVTRRTWWNHLYANPVGYLPAEARVGVVSLDLPERRVLPFGPDWLAGWHAVFLAALTVGAVAVKFGRGIR